MNKDKGDAYRIGVSKNKGGTFFFGGSGSFQGNYLLLFLKFLLDLLG